MSEQKHSPPKITGIMDKHKRQLVADALAYLNYQGITAWQGATDDYTLAISVPTNGELNLDVFLAPIEIERLAHEWQGMVAIARQVMQPFTRNTKES